MADEDQIPTDVENNIDQSLDKKPTRRKRQPTYQVVGDSKIPVSKANGKLWKSRLAQWRKVSDEVVDTWEEAIRYFDNDQSKHRLPTEHAAGNLIGNQRLNNNITETENVVFSNITTMVPALYARNPNAEFTSATENNKRFTTILERLVNVIGTRRPAPGINLKPKAKRCVVTTLLTNRSWVELNWVHKQDSSEQALEDLEQLAKDLQKAKKPQQITEIEGKIDALEKGIDILQPAGPTAKVRSPFDVAVDPNSRELDASDANWIMVRDYLPTTFILARYAEKKKGSDEYKSIYKPTHIMKAKINEDDESHDDDVFSVYEPKEKMTNFGFDDEETFERAKMTEVWMVWDKITRRVLMYNSKDWTWPIWVWDDPLQLDTFYPLYPLFFYDGPRGPLTKGEVTYYLDQQDAINEITDEERRARRWARRNIFYNKNLVEREDAEAVLNGDDGTARGLNIPEGMKVTDVIGSVVPPSMQFEKLFDKENKYRAIDRISSVGEVLRGAQFKTNTTNDAVQANVSATNMRVDEKSDQIEDWIGSIYWGLAQLCLQYMDVETVVSLIGEEAREVWQNMSAQEIRDNFSVQVVGGSTKKPTSQAKKEEALELGQVLGQFVNAAPGPVLKIMLEVMQEAFDEVTIREEDWTTILQAVEQQAAGQQQPQQGGPPPQQGQQVPPQGGGEGQIPPDQLQQVLQQLPTEVKAQVAQAIDSGMPPQQALQAAMQQMQQPQQPPMQ